MNKDYKYFIFLFNLIVGKKIKKIILYLIIFKKIENSHIVEFVFLKMVMFQHFIFINLMIFNSFLSFEKNCVLFNAFILSA